MPSPEDATEPSLRRFGSSRLARKAGNVFTLYDFKATSLSDDGAGSGEESSAPTPKEFWGSWNPDLLHIGAREQGDVEAFKRWLLAQVA